MLKKLLVWLVAGLTVAPLAGRAQVVPAVPAAAPASLSGVALRDWLRQNWYDPYRVVLSYDAARTRMYNYADNYQNTVVCVYSGYSESVPYTYPGTSTGVVNNINCEHSIPQSWFRETVRMRSDMHHLFPTYIQWNSNRGSDPFADIPDNQTTLWMRLTQSQSGIPTTNIDEYSEDGPGKFEPREDHKGNLARAAFYFYTMHAGQPDLVGTGHGDISSIAPLNTLYQWHLADPVDAHERERNRRVAASQGNYNPYIEYPELVAPAWGFTPTGPVVSFATATGSIAEGNNATSTYTATLSLSQAATTATTVQVALDATASTATSGSDFTFATPTTVTFAAGQTSQTVTVTVNGDTQPETDETVVLTLQSASTGTSIGGPATHTLTILNDDGAPPTVAFATASGSIPEGNTSTSTYTVNVVLANAASLTYPVTVPLTVAATSTATSPSDYTLSATQVTFSNATTSQPVVITVVGDVVPEANETVVLRLGQPSNAALLLGTPATHTLTILNDDVPPAGGACSDAFFTKYFESSAGNTKALEIFNPTPTPLDLANLRVELFTAGSSTPTTTQALTGSLASGRTYVIANTGVTDAGVRAVANLQSGVCFFSGAHTLVLFDGTDTLDVIGVVGRTPAGGTSSGWAVASGGTTRDNSLVRLPATGRGNSRWFGTSGAATTWQAQGTDNFAGLGSYTSTACATALPVRGGLDRTTLEIFPNPATGRATLRLPGLPARLATVEVLDALGRPVRRLPATPLGDATPATLEVAGLPAGIYAVRVQAGDAQFVSRLVVE